MSGLDREVCYRALRTRDARFDGRFFTAVVTTGIYCRPTCPARTPKLDHCLFVPSAAAAHQLGFRPCLRCRPELAPSAGGWRGTANTVSRALSLMAEGGWDEGGADELATRLGVGARHLRRLFDEHVGATPVSVAQAHRLLFAKKLIGETSLTMTDVALASGFGSIRRFNDAFKKTYARTPSSLRRAPTRAESGVLLRLPMTGPFDWQAMIGFFAARAIPGIESVKDGTYRRRFAIAQATGTLSVERRSGELALRIETSDVRAIGAVVARVRRMFDLDADLETIDAYLCKDPTLRRLVRARPGVRVPGAWDPFELAVRAVLGQQVSVRAATTLAGRVASLGNGKIAPNVLLRANLREVGLTRARAQALETLARAVARDPRVLDSKDSLLALPGIGPWTAEYVMMRAARDPDAFPSSDLGLLRAMGGTTPRALERRAEAWRPWRAYAAMRLWAQA